MDYLCNKDSDECMLWSNRISWDTPYPRLTRCFECTVLNWIPLSFLLVSILFYVPMMKRRKTIDYNCRGTLNILKSILIIFSLYGYILSLLYIISEAINNLKQTRAMFLKPILSALSSVLLVYVNRLTFSKGIHSSGILFVYWFIKLTTTLISTISTYLTPEIRNYKAFILYANTTELVLVFLIFVLYCFSDVTVCTYYKLNRTKISDQTSSSFNSNNLLQTSPELAASYLSKLTFFWFNGLLWKGYKKPVKFTDLFDLRYKDRCDTVVKIFREKWNNESLKIYKKIIAKVSSTQPSRSASYSSLQTNQTNDNSNQNHCTQHVISPSLIKVLFEIVGCKYVLYGVVRILVDLIMFVQPQLLKALIIFIESTNSFSWQGYIIVLLMLMVSVLRTVVYQQYNHISNVTGMRLRTGLISFLYRKVLKLSPSSRKNTTLGEVINLMSVDSHKLTSLTFDIHSIFSTPIMMVVGFYFLWQQLGISTLTGIALMLCIIPINVLIGVKVKTLQGKQLLLKDSRIKLMSEMLNGIKVFKLYGWEKSFEDRIQSIREEECRILRLSTYMNSLSAVSCFCAPYLIALCSFATFILSSSENVLDANTAFVSLSLVNLLNTPMSYLPGTIAFVAQGYVSILRINNMLIKEELRADNVNYTDEAERAISVINGTFSWATNEEDILKNVNMEISEGELIAVVGQVGCGKSSLINAILGEMHKVVGEVKLKGSVAYVPQQAWCQNATIQNNIIFGKLLNQKKYQQVVEVCALNPDLEILCDGDQSEVGEKGINLSGGQKQRISIARAIYQDASIYLFDDPLSAVDVHVNKHIFDKVIGKDGILSTRTRILVTNNIAHLTMVDRIVFMKSGRIVDSGPFEKLLQKNNDFADFVKLYIEQEKKTEEHYDNYGTIVNSRNSSISESANFEERQKRNHMRRKSSNKLNSTSTVFESNDNPRTFRLIKDEFIETGKVKLAVFLSYMRPATYPIILVIFLTYLIYISSSIAGNVYLSSWSEKNSKNQSQNLESRNTFLMVYGGLAVVQTVVILIENICLAHGTFLASKSLHYNLLKTLVRVPNLFFDTTPTGRILNRVGRDIDTVDINIPSSIAAWLLTASGVIGTIVVISIATPYFMLALVPLSVLYYFIQKFYIRTNRQLKRLDAVTRSPLYSHFHETITGVTSIRAYGRSHSFIERCDFLIDQNQIAWYLNILSFRWLQFNLECIGTLIIFFSGLFAVIARNEIGAGLAGLSVSYALLITISLNNMVRNTCDLESHVVSVERIEEYTTLKEEVPWIIKETRPPHNWPSNGKVEFYNYSMKYRPELNFVLRNVNLIIHAGEKLGIVGRTGSGKSSLALALFRLIEPTEGQILIDNIDIGLLGLHDLRSKITIIPQDPVLYSGTLRLNLDPFSCYCDDEIWNALELVHLKPFVTQIPQQLQFLVSENGDNLSVGQKQLVCLARALLKKTQILVMDEATAAIDQETDQLIQRSIRNQFHHCTVLTIAHRLNTIMDYDKILILEQGRIMEIGPPNQLLTDETSLFSKLINEAGLKK